MEKSGLTLDRHLVNVRFNSWVNALNMQREISQDTIDVESGFVINDDCIKTQYPIIGKIVCNNEYILFCTDNVSSQIVSSRLGIILNDTYLNFNNNFPITGVFTYNHKQELIIVFTDYNNTPKILNVDNPPFLLGEDKSIFYVKDRKHLELFPQVKEPIVEIVDVNTNGTLLSGVYFIVSRYTYEDSSATSWIGVNNPIYIYDGNTDNFNATDGCEGGILTNKNIQLHIENLDETFKYLEIAVITKINGILTANKISTYQYDGTTLDINIGSNINDPVPLKEILINSAIYLKVKSFTNLNNELFGGKVKGLPLLDFQPYANDIIANWVLGSYISYNGLKGSYKDNTVTYYNKSFRPGEVYGLLIALKLKHTGTYALYPLIGREAKETELDIITDVAFNDIDEDIKNFQVYDTSTINADNNSGDFGYWQNETDKYPSTFPASIQKPNVILANTPIRLFKFPTLQKLESINPILTEHKQDSTVITQSDILLSDNTYSYSQNNIVNAGTFAYEGRKFTAALTTYVTILHNLSVSVPIENTSTINVTAKIEHYSAFNVKLSTILERNIACGAGDTFDIPIELHFKLKHGEYLTFTLYDNDFTHETIIDHSIDFTFSASNVLQGTLTTKPLGITLSNIVIPQEIRQYIDGYEIYYYQRDNNNITRLDQDVINLQGFHSEEDTQFRMHGFDTLSNKITASPSYIEHIANLPIIRTTNSHVVPGKYQPITSEVIPSTYTVLTNVTFVPAHNNATEYDNLCRENAMIYKTTVPINISNTALRLYDACLFKKDMYLGGLQGNIPVVSTGMYIPLNDIDAQVPVSIFGGDTYISLYSYMIYTNPYSLDPTNPNYNTSWYRIILTIPYYSISNVGLRHEGQQLHQKYYPKSNITELNFIDPSTPPTGIFVDMYQNGNDYTYNNDFNTLNSIKSQYIWGNPSNFNVTFSNRIIRSLPMLNESTQLQWRCFPITNYYDIPNDKGEIVTLLTHGQNIIIGCFNSCFKVFVKDVLSTLNTNNYLSKGDIFDREPVEILDSREGIIGIQNQECLISTPYGALAFDRVKCKLYLIGETIIPINQSDVYSFLKEHLTFDTEYTKYNILLASLTSYIEASANTGLAWKDTNIKQALSKLDNPYIDKGVILGYELTNQFRIFVTARNKTFFPNKTLNEVATLTNTKLKDLQYYTSSLVLDIKGGAYHNTELVLVLNQQTLTYEEGQDTTATTFKVFDNPIEQVDSIYNMLLLSLTENNLNDKYAIIKYLNTIQIIALLPGSEYNISGDFEAIIGTTSIYNFIVYIDNSFTLSYSLDDKYWVSRHSYQPMAYIPIRNSTIIADGMANLPNHQTYSFGAGNIGEYTKFTTPINIQNVVNDIIPIKASYIDFSFNFKQQSENIYLSSVSWVNIALNKLGATINKTFDKIMVYNNNQSSYYIPLVNVNGKQKGTLEFHNGVWYCNTMRNELLSTYSESVFLDKNYEPVSSLYINQITDIILPYTTYEVTNIEDEITDKVIYKDREMNYNGAKFTTDDNITVNFFGNAKIKNLRKWFEISEICCNFVVIRLFTDNSLNLKHKLILVHPFIQARY